MQEGKDPGMQIIKGTTDFIIKEGTAVAIGKFDGLHLGHRKLLAEFIKHRVTFAVKLGHKCTRLWIVSSMYYRRVGFGCSCADIVSLINHNKLELISGKLSGNGSTCNTSTYDCYVVHSSPILLVYIINIYPLTENNYWVKWVFSIT